MKRCPECRRDYYDDTLLYCLDDGNALLEGPRSEPGAVGTGFPSDEPQTAILHSTAAPGEAATRAQINTTDQTAILRTGVEAEPRESLGGLSERQSLSAHRAAKPLAALVVAVLILVGGFFAYRYFSPAKQINSIAVMPFENRNSDADTDYLSDGLAESLIFRLTQIPDLRVSPTSSVMRYKGKETDIAKIASELGVDAVMTGRLTKRGDNLNITVELVDARTNKSLWGEQYERKLSELLTTQREIVTEIVVKLQLKLSGAGEQTLAKKYTDNNEAYQLYLKGRFYWNKRNAENLRKAIEQFQAAADRDPNFALAFVGLADCYVLLPFYETAPSPEAVPRAKSYAQRALEIDSSLGEAHASLAYTNYMLWSWVEVEPGLKRAIELSPNYATGHKWYGNFLEDSFRREESLQKFQKAQELDPLSLITTENLAELYLSLGDMDAAFRECSKVIELDPNYAGIRRSLSLIHLKQGRNAEALAEAQKGVDLSKRLSALLGNLGYVQARTGNKNEAMVTLKELEDLYSRKAANGHHIAAVYAGLGDKENAFLWLEKDYQNRTSTLVAWMSFVHFESMDDDPRMADLRRRIGLPLSSYSVDRP